jgi:hypothetical protein
MKNPVAKHGRTFNHAQTFRDRKKEQRLRIRKKKHKKLLDTETQGQ